MRTITIVMILLAIVGIQSCGGSASKLSREIDGQWTSRSENLNVPRASASQATFTYLFHRNAGENGGTVKLSALIDVALPAGNDQGASHEPLSVCATAVATASGTWRATSDDEIYLMVDPASVEVSVDPTAVVARGRGDSNSPTDTIPAAASMIRHEIAKAVERKVATMHRLNDIKLDRDRRTLQWEANYTDVNLRRQ